jgi:two-component system sensor histidine kinase/response regulator
MVNATILVVEDDTHLMEGIRDILELNGYDVLTATNGSVGLEVLQNQSSPPDLIVSDIMMPRMDGYDFFNAVRERENWVAIPFIFLTAKGERDDIFRGKSMGAEDYVVKPFDADELLVAVDSRLKRHRELNKRRDQEVSNIKHNILNILNHEFRTPLTYVVAYADMLHRDADELGVNDMRTFLRGINSGANRLRRLVENFILLVELETGEALKTYEWRRTSFATYGELLCMIWDKYADLAAEQRVSVNIHVDDHLPPIKADADYLSAALECLVENAIKFTEHPGREITLRAFQDAGYVCLAVIDQGRGIPQNELGNIFKPFYQINRDRYEDQGAGSGLAIVDGVVRLHGGSAAVESTFGEGSTFTIRLPIAAEDDDAA